jgi:hypothetical protein
MQRPEYAGGSVAKGFYRFRVKATERSGPSIAHFEFFGRAEFPPGDGKRAAEARDAAIKATWEAAREWLREIGDLRREERELVSDG